MTAKDLFQAGRLDEAVQALGAELRNDPTDVQRRTFLFELLCFSGEYDRAEKQLDILADASSAAGMGTLLYRAALHAERTRRQMFETVNPSPAERLTPPPGPLTGSPSNRFRTRIRASARAWRCTPPAPISGFRSSISPPSRFSLPSVSAICIWIPALIRPGPAFKGRELGEVLLPVLTPLAWKHGDDAVRLGRETRWEETGDGQEIPAGQKMFLVDEEEYPILEVRKLEFSTAPAAAGGDNS